MKIGELTFPFETRFRKKLLRLVPWLLMFGGVWIANVALSRVMKFRIRGLSRWQRMPLRITRVEVGIS